MALLESISPSKGSPAGGQTVTVTGAWTGYTGTITIDGNEVEASISAGSATFVTPAHRGADGALAGGGAVDIVVTVGGVDYVGVYTYTSTLIERFLDKVRARVAALSAQDGSFYTFSASQVQSFKTDQSADTGAEWPQAIVFQGSTSNAQPPDIPFGFVVDTVACTAQAVMPLEAMEDWPLQLNWLVADLYRAVMLSRNDTAGLANDVHVDSSYIGQVTDPASGALGVAVVEFTVEVLHIHNDMTTNTEYTA